MGPLRTFAGFESRIDRLPYALAAPALFFSQHLVIFLAALASGHVVVADARFWIVPVTLLGHVGASPQVLAVAMLALLAIAWALTALSFARSAASGISGWAGALAPLPAIQVLVLFVLAFPPSRTDIPSVDPSDPPVPIGERFRMATAAQGVLVGVGICVLAVALSTLVFGAYGYGLFVLSPFIVGDVTGHLANRRRDIGARGTVVVVILALGIGAVALIAVALEGVVCIVMAMPLAIVAGILGGLFGRAIANRRRGPVEANVFAVALLPLLFSIEHTLTSESRFQSDESVIVAAPPEAVWGAVVAMGPISEQPSLPFQLGLAYPIDGKILSTGVGGIREGRFSTGIAYERITAWRPGHELAFAVLSDPPMLRELSPYKDVQAPHLLGYYHTGAVDFLITPLPDAHTRLTLRTTHVLKLEPAPYWTPFAEWAVHTNDLRVLGHFKHVAEASLTSAPR